MAIISAVRKVFGIDKAKIILQPRDSHDITSEETQELAALIRTLNFEHKVDVATGLEQVGKGITAYEVLRIWIITGDVFLAKQIAQEVAKVALKWACDRLKRKEAKRRPTYIAIYGPNGKVLRSMVVKDANQEAEDRTKADRKLRTKFKPPLLKEKRIESTKTNVRK